MTKKAAEGSNSDLIRAQCMPDWGMKKSTCAPGPTYKRLFFKITSSEKKRLKYRKFLDAIVMITKAKNHNLLIFIIKFNKSVPGICSWSTFY
jgi:Zn/Cd-binding protein ZinT